jgi:hypothetical protein
MTQPVRIAARSERSLSFTLVRVQGGERVVVRERRSGLHPIWFWIGTAVTGVSGVSGIVLGVVTIGKSSDIEADPLPNTDDRDSGERLALLTDIAFGGMIVFGTASLLLYLNTDWGEGEDASEHARLAPGLSIGPDHAVLSLGGSL